METVNKLNWSFANLNETEAKAYIKNALAKGFTINPDNGRIMTAPKEIEEYEGLIKDNLITGLFLNTITSAGVAKRYVTVSLSKPISYLNPETLDIEPISSFRLNNGLDAFLGECSVDFLDQVDEGFKDKALAKFKNKVTVDVTVRVNKGGEDALGAYGFSSVASYSVTDDGDVADVVMAMLERAVKAKTLTDALSGGSNDIIAGDRN